MCNGLIDARLWAICVDCIKYYILLKLTLYCLFLGRFLNVYPANAHRGPDFSVNTEPDDGVSSTVQSLF